MASLLGKITQLARSPQGQKALSTATRKAQQLAKDPATRAKINSGAAKVREQVGKRRGTSTSGTTATSVPLDDIAPPGGHGTVRPDDFKH